MADVHEQAKTQSTNEKYFSLVGRKVITENVCNSISNPGSAELSSNHSKDSNSARDHNGDGNFGSNHAGNFVSQRIPFFETTRNNGRIVYSYHKQAKIEHDATCIPSRRQVRVMDPQSAVPTQTQKSLQSGLNRGHTDKFSQNMVSQFQLRSTERVKSDLLFSEKNRRAKFSRRSIHLQLIEERRVPKHEFQSRNSFFFGRSRRRSLSHPLSASIDSFDEPDSVLKSGKTFLGEKLVDRGSIRISWFEGTSTIELQDHVIKSLERKLVLGLDAHLENVRVLDDSFDTYEEIVLSPHIPDGSSFFCEIFYYKKKILRRNHFQFVDCFMNWILTVRKHRIPPLQRQVLSHLLQIYEICRSS